MEQQPPMDDASSLPPQDPAAMGSQPPMPEAPAPEPPMDDMGGGEIQNMYDGLNQEHQKAAKRYIQSLEDQESEQNEGGEAAEMGGGEPAPAAGGDMGPGAMNESVIFTKKQLKKINEGLGGMDDELERTEDVPHTTKLKSDKNKPVSPFDPPRKNRK